MIIAAARLVAPVLDPSQGLHIGQASERVHAAGVETKRAGAANHTGVVFFRDGGHHHSGRLLALVAPSPANDTYAGNT